MKRILAIALLGVAMADYLYQKPVGSAPQDGTDDKRPDSREGDNDDFPTTRDHSYGAPDGMYPGRGPNSYKGHHGDLQNVHYNDERYYARYGHEGNDNDRFAHRDATAMVGDMTAKYEIEDGWRWSCEEGGYYDDSINVQVWSPERKAMTSATYCNFDFEACRRVCEEFDDCAGFDVRTTTDADEACPQMTALTTRAFINGVPTNADNRDMNGGTDNRRPTVCTLKNEDDVMPMMRKLVNTTNASTDDDWGVTCTKTRGRPSRECPEDMALVPLYAEKGPDGTWEIDMEYASDGSLCIDWTSPLDFEEYTALIGFSNRKHHDEPVQTMRQGHSQYSWQAGIGGEEPLQHYGHGTYHTHDRRRLHSDNDNPLSPSIYPAMGTGDGPPPAHNTAGHPDGEHHEVDARVRTPWGVIDTRVRKSQSNWPLIAARLITWRKTFGQGGRTCRDGNAFTKSDCMASQYAAAVVCERRGLTLCTTEQYQAFADWQRLFNRELSYSDPAMWETSSPRDKDGNACAAESYEKLDNEGVAQGCSEQKNAEEMFAYKCCEEFRHKHVQVDGYVIQHDHQVNFRVNSTDIMKHNHFDAIPVSTFNGMPYNAAPIRSTWSRQIGQDGKYWIPEKQFRVHTHYATDGTRFTHRHYTSMGDGHQHDRRWDILYGHDGQGHAQGHSYNGFEGPNAAGYDFNFGYDARQGYARGDYGDGHVHSEQHGHEHEGHDPDGQNYGPGFRTSHSHSQYDIHGFGHAGDIPFSDIPHETHYVAQ